MELEDLCVCFGGSNYVRAGEVAMHAVMVLAIYLGVLLSISKMFPGCRCSQTIRKSRVFDYFSFSKGKSVLKKKKVRANVIFCAIPEG